MTRHPVFGHVGSGWLRKVGLATMAAATVGLLAACAASASSPVENAGERPAAPVVTTPEAGPAGLSVRDLIPLLTRYGVGPREIGLDVIYAPQLFFDVTGMERPAAHGARPTLLFIIEESIHDGDLAELADTPPAAFLLLEDGTRLAPFEATLVTEDPHHRTSRVVFDRPAGWPETPTTDAPLTVRVVVPMEDGSVSIANTFEWLLPIETEAATTTEGG